MFLLGANLLGTLGSVSMNTNAQSAANKANLQAVRETNLSNQSIAARNNATMISLGKQTNDTAIQQTQLANAANAQNLRTQHAEQLAQWNRENAYNDPSAVAERMRRAGFNPLFGLDGGSNASSLSLASPAAVAPPSGLTNPAAGISTPTMVAGHVDPVVSDYRNMIHESLDAIAKAQDIKIRSNDASVDHELKLAELHKRFLDGRISRAQYHRLVQDNIWRDEDRNRDVKLADEQVKRSVEETKQSEERTKQAQIQTAIADLNKQQITKMNPLEIKRMNKTIQQLDATISNLRQSYKHAENEEKRKQAIHNFENSPYMKDLKKRLAKASTDEKEVIARSLLSNEIKENIGMWDAMFGLNHDELKAKGLSEKDYLDVQIENSPLNLVLRWLGVDIKSAAAALKSVK